MAAPVKVARQQTTSELSGTFRNLPPEPTPFYTGTLRNLPEPASGTYTSKTPEPSGTFRNLPPEPAPATCTVTHRSLSGLKTPLAYAVGEKRFLGRPCPPTPPGIPTMLLPSHRIELRTFFRLGIQSPNHKTTEWFFLPKGKTKKNNQEKKLTYIMYIPYTGVYMYIIVYYCANLC